jgi:hypothetical protein
MRFIPISVQRSFVRGAAVVLVATAANPSAAPLNSQSSQVAVHPDVRSPDEAAGIDAIARVLIAVFDHVDIVALGEAHFRRVDSDLNIALIRQPDFERKVRAAGGQEHPAHARRHTDGVEHAPPWH